MFLLSRCGSGLGYGGRDGPYSVRPPARAGLLHIQPQKRRWDPSGGRYGLSLFRDAPYRFHIPFRLWRPEMLRCTAEAVAGVIIIDPASSRPLEYRAMHASLFTRPIRHQRVRDAAVLGVRGNK